MHNPYVLLIDYHMYIKNLKNKFKKGSNPTIY